MILVIILYMGLHYMTLNNFPYVHSDESWLSGLTRTVLDKGSFNTSEPFFDLYPRAVHGLRLVFVTLQGMVIKVFGYSITAMRSLSLLASLAVLSTLSHYFYSKKNTGTLAFLIVLTLGLMPQFLMASHLARQEPLILLGMVTAYTLVQKTPSTQNTLLITGVIGLCIGVHPNSFLIGCGIGFIYLYQTIKKQRTLRDLLLFIASLGLWACAFVGISLIINPNFIQDYLAFGNQLGVVNYSVNRFQGFYYYYYKLWHQIGGTYYLVNTKFDLTSGLLSLILGFFLLSSSRFSKKYDSVGPSILMFIGVNVGLLIIGRYNQTAIIFPLVIGWLTFGELITCLPFDKKRLIPLLCILCALQGINAYKAVTANAHQDYNAFAQEVTHLIPEDARVLANLNLDYHLNLYQLYDIRNLDYLDENNLSIEGYILKNDIRYIVLYDEMDYIADSKGKWSILYGDLNYYHDLKDYIHKHGTLINTIEGPTYAMRIAKYVDVYPWEAKVYKLDR